VTSLRVKDVAREPLYCPYFELPRSTLMEHATRRHEELKNRVKELLERKHGVKCEIEKEVNLPNGMRGRIDLLCKGEGKDIIVEVKSSHPSKLLLSDLMQLALYAYCYKESSEGNFQRELDLYLAYRGPDGDPVLIKIGERLRKELEDVAKTIVSNLALKNPNANKPKVLVLGPFCRFCGKEGCLFKPRPTVQGA